MRQPAMLMAFQWRELGIFSTSGSYATIEKITYIAVSCSVLLFFSKQYEFAIYLVAVLVFATIVEVYLMKKQYAVQRIFQVFKENINIFNRI